MKRCPTCDKTYEDNLRFCQTDGTPLVDAVEEIDPYKTMVARPEDIRAAMPVTPEPAAAEESVLELPEEPDPNKTQFVSEDELRAEMSRGVEDVVDIPPATEPEPAATPDQFSMTSPPIPSPFEAKPFEPASFEPQVVEPAAQQFSEPEPPAPQFTEPEPPAPQFTQPAPPASPFADAPASPFAEPEPPKAEPVYSPFEHSAPVAEPMMKAEWTPPAAPEASWQNQEIGQNTPFQPPPAGASGENKTLAIVSLATGVLSCLCCFSILTGPAAVVMGFMAKGKASSNPAEYGGAGLAIGGIITGVIGTLIGLAAIILQIFFGGLNAIMNM